ncbi:hypothetical protein SNE40_012469 [Patella caerulea]|uniref:Bromo domain-containing protein n=1 Tax=Patella caerulea TaxID=87958 RepID=A0AAN8PQM5_PATCE
MVRTRHNPIEDEGSEFITIGTRGSRRSQDPPPEDDLQSDESGVSSVPRRELRRNQSYNYNPQRMSRRPRRANRSSFFYEDSTEDDEPPRQSRRSSRPQVDRKKSRSWRQREVLAAADAEDEDEGMHPEEIRRSTRQKKTVYPTLNKNFLDKAVVSAKDGYGDTEESLPPRKRTRVEGDGEGEDEGGEEVEGDECFTDMYSRVKRKRRHIRRDMYGVPIIDTDCETSGESSGEEEEEEVEEEEEDDDGDDKPQRSYFLREHKPRTQKYEAPSIKPQRRPRSDTVFSRGETPPRTISSFRRSKTYRSPAHRRKRHRKRAAFHGSSSTSSSSDTGSNSSDEERFQRRKAKSMMKSRNRCLPFNLTKEDMNTGILKDRAKIGASLADIDPMEVDRSITFESVGGLDKHVRALKEMVVFPLLYPEIFERFKITPPRGCIFYGPPGTGKTLVARALANECSHGDKRVAFFMRKGADCLSKWVGESERQLRLLFDQAYQARPSIIFFDEIDGLAPVRSSRQDQIHSSIVSTLLALMDGLDSRGEVVVIGATNRIDSIDPALRRPGRFDREFLFPLPSLSARTQILKIHTKGWTPRLSGEFISELGERCVGYCGADMKALCTEATLMALRRRYPQIYASSEKLQLDVQSINLAAKDFYKAMQTIVPTAQRSIASPGRCLPTVIRPLLKRLFDQTLRMLQETFPSVLAQMSSLDAPNKNTGEGDNGLDDLYSDEDKDEPSIYEKSNRGNHRHDNNLPPSFLSFSNSAYQRPTTFRPRLLISGSAGQGQTSHLGPAILHHMEQLPVHVIDLPTLYAVSAKTPEESCAQVFCEARRTAPSIIYLPFINKWWDVIGETLRATFLTLVQNLSPSSPLLMLATCEVSYNSLDSTLQGLFDLRSQEVIQMTNPTTEERREYYQDLVMNQSAKPVSSKHSAAARRALEVLPVAPPPKPRKLTEAELKKLKNQEDATLRELRIFLRDVLTKLGRDRKFSMFTKPVDLEEVPDYLVIIKQPMDMSTMMTKIDLHEYLTVKSFMSDIDLICRNALEYNPAKDPQGRAIRHRACAFKDTAYAIIKAELNSDFEKQCQEIKEARERRGLKSRDVPDFYYTAPPVPSRVTPNQPPKPTPPPIPSTERFSRRVRGIHVDTTVPLEMVEKNWAVEKRLSKNSPDKVDHSEKRRSVQIVQHEHSSRSRDNSAKKVRSESSSVRPKKKAKKCIWSSTKRRRRPKSVAAVYDRDSDARSGLDTDMDDDSDFGMLSDREEEIASKTYGEEVKEVKTVDVPVVQDSGLGSSLDSNGDSRDSVDHRVNGEDLAQVAEEEKSRNKSSARKSTQSHDSSSHKVPAVTTDKHRLSRLLDTVVMATSGNNIERLEKMYSILSQCIYRHRKSYDKIPLIKEMEEKVTWYTKQKSH